MRHIKKHSTKSMKNATLVFIILLLLIILGGILLYLFNGSLPQGIDAIPATTDMEMIYIPAGEFLMGSDTGDPNQRPLRTVYLDAYWIDQTEVTNRHFNICIIDGGCRSLGPNTYLEDDSRGSHPVVYVTLDDAFDFCHWAGKTLPTEAQWEKAARGEDGRVYPWGDSAPNPNRLNYYDHIGSTTPVGSYPSGASPFGVLDMAGNVWEWTSDWYDAKYYQRAPSVNPPGPDIGARHVKRGGSWFTLADSAVTTTFRKHTGSTNRDYNIGFRCVFMVDQN
jgi:eukaryotic-like serine/threonine-protein kinase